MTRQSIWGILVGVPAVCFAQVVLESSVDSHSVVIPYFTQPARATVVVSAPPNAITVLSSALETFVPPITTFPPVVPSNIQSGPSTVNAVTVLSNALGTFTITYPIVAPTSATSAFIPPRPVAGSTYRSGNAVSVLSSALQTFSLPSSGYSSAHTIVIPLPGPSTTGYATITVPAWAPPAQSTLTTHSESSAKPSGAESSRTTGPGIASSVVVQGSSVASERSASSHTTGPVASSAHSSASGSEVTATRVTTELTTRATTELTTRATTELTTRATTELTTRATTEVTTKATTKVTSEVKSTVKETATVVESVTSSVIEKSTTIATSQTFVTRTSTEVQTVTSTGTVHVTSVPPAPNATNLAAPLHLPAAVGAMLAGLAAYAVL